MVLGGLFFKLGNGKIQCFTLPLQGFFTSVYPKAGVNILDEV